ncbi:hypothetical protein PZU20_22615 [Pseudomonas aeruginosa]|uniref:hypothetical protein n=1 Tax=Pseudomonas aeruginosa TaxID=287 RepID=UPI000BDCAB49|nr:hypothetical protein [Pseudomonas aeruginosa]MEA8541120.1 hypothetical protein [Pseudomonas aeruginosa]OZB42718.1 MAG: hypothetical protein B7X50_03170 [Alishewanella sp. 34-51-39]
MNPMNEQAIFDEIAHNDLHFSKAPNAFFHAWKRGVELVGPGLFGNGTQECLHLAVDKWDLCPNVAFIKKTIGAMSSGERVFLAAMVSFYNSKDGGALLKRVGVHGLADLGGLDLERRKIIAALILNYTGW